MRYPDAPRLDVVEDLHGQRVADPYRWLEDADDPRTKEWAAAQDDLFMAYRSGLTAARDRFRDRLAALSRAGWVGAPIWRGARRFGVRREPDQEHAVLVVSALDADERVLVDPMALDPVGTTTLDIWQPSVEGDRLAYGISLGGTEESEVYVIDVATGAVVEGPIDRARNTMVAWLPGGEEYFYQRHEAGEEGIHHRRIYRHRVGADPSTDRLVFGVGAERATYFSVRTSRDGRWLLVSSARGTDPRNDLWLADLAAPSGDRVFVPVLRDVDAQVWARVHGDRLLMRTNLDAPRGRICVAPVTGPVGPADWQTLVPEDPEAVLTDFGVIDGAGLIVVAWQRHAFSEVTVHDLATGAAVGTVDLPGLGTITELTTRPEGGDEAWLGYHSYATPQQILRWDATTRTTVVESVAPGVASGEVDPADVTVRQVTYPSKDGTPVRMFILTSGSAGPRPTVLYGYGGFDISMLPQYWPVALAWVEAGGAFAVANLRGGGEAGEEWHRAGMGAHKQNVFDDFHAAADWLVDNGVATSLGCYGGSNGGLLVGAALTQRPDRFDAVVCSAPLLDMVRFELFGLGPNWIGEYGTATDPEEFGWLLGYSPYHRVHPGTAYPAVLFTVFEGDTRVDPLHARKMAAALQHATSGERPILLRRETGVGHSVRAVTRTVDLGADVMSFFAATLRL
jgi:prolyl oligopeptidase